MGSRAILVLYTTESYGPAKDAFLGGGASYAQGQSHSYAFAMHNEHGRADVRGGGKQVWKNNNVTV